MPYTESKQKEIDKMDEAHRKVVIRNEEKLIKIRKLIEQREGYRR